MTRYNLALEKMERELFTEYMKKHNNNQSAAAKDMGISRGTLYARLVQYGMHVPLERAAPKRKVELGTPPTWGRELRAWGYKQIGAE